MLLCLTALYAQRADNYPPTKNAQVKLSETNLPIVFIDVDGKMILLFSSLGHPNFKIGWPYRSNHKVYVVPHPFQVSSPRPAWIEHECS